MQSLSDADFRAVVDRIKADDSKYVDGDIRMLISHCHTLRAEATLVARTLRAISHTVPDCRPYELAKALDNVVSQTAVRVPA